MKGDARALKRLDPATRVVLLYGGDTSASADLARGVIDRLPDRDGETIIPAVALTGDPAALLAAASEIPMFGGLRPVRVDDAGEDVLPAVAQLLDARVAGSPVIIVAGALKKGSKLVARVEAAADALAVVNHLPDAAGTARAISEIAVEHGLRLTRDAVELLAQATGGDRGIVRQEIAKLALFVDASPAKPREASAAGVRAVGAEFADLDLGTLVDGIAGGNATTAGRQLVELDASAIPRITALRAVTRRFLLLLDLRAAVDGGASASVAVKSARPPLFWRDHDAVAAQLARWSTTATRAALARLLAAERAVKRSGSAGDVTVDQLLLSLAVQAGRGGGRA